MQTYFFKEKNIYGLGISPDGKRVVYLEAPIFVFAGSIQTVPPFLSVILKGSEPHWWVDENGREFIVFQTIDAQKSYATYQEANTQERLTKRRLMVSLLQKKTNYFLIKVLRLVFPPMDVGSQQEPYPPSL